MHGQSVRSDRYEYSIQTLDLSLHAWKIDSFKMHEAH